MNGPLRANRDETIAAWNGLNLKTENARLRGSLESIVDFCKNGDWLHGVDGDDSSSWYTCEGRDAVESMASDALDGAMPVLEAPVNQLHTALEHILQAGDGLAKADAALQEYNAVHGDYSYALNDAVDAALRRYTAAYAAARAALKLKRSE